MPHSSQFASLGHAFRKMFELFQARIFKRNRVVTLLQLTGMMELYLVRLTATQRPVAILRLTLFHRMCLDR